jgi:hypothetical protein
MKLKKTFFWAHVLHWAQCHIQLVASAWSHTKGGKGDLLYLFRVILRGGGINVNCCICLESSWEGSGIKVKDPGTTAKGL